MWHQEEVLKCIWHAFAALDVDHRGKVSKSQLKVLSLNLCNVMKIAFDPRVLEDHFKDEDTGPLSNQGYMPYLTNYILSKVKVRDDFATLDLFKFCWTLSYKKNLSIKHHISHDDAFKVWCIFNFLSETKYPLLIVTQEVEHLLKLLTDAMSDAWSEGKMAEHHLELSFTKKSLTAWELIELVDVHFFKNTSSPALSAAINEVFEELILGILKQGYMFKKCHKGKKMTDYWFVLRPNSLEYYTSKDLMVIKGIVAISSNCTVESLPDKNGRMCAFLIKYDGTGFEMSASDKAKKKEWLQAIEKCIQIQKLGLLPPQREARERRRQQREMQKSAEDKVTELMRQLQANNESKQRELDALKKVRFVMEEQVSQKTSELLHCLRRVQELEEALEEERRAKEEEQDTRKRQERHFEEEALKRAELELMIVQQQRALSQSQAQRRLPVAPQLDKERQLQEPMQQLEGLRMHNHGADQQYEGAPQILEHAIGKTKSLKNKVARHERPMRVMQPGHKGPLMITNWGLGAFTEAELELRKKSWQQSTKWSAAAE